MRFDLAKMKPGWSHSRIKTFDACPLRWGWKYVAGRKEEVGEAALTGRIVSQCAAEIRTRWLESGADVRFSGHLEKVARKAAEEEAIGEDVVDEALKIVTTGFNHLPLLPRRGLVKAWWVEERFAFDRDWRRIRFREEEAKWWGTREQREQTLWRMVPDFAWLDVHGVLHVEDDKALWGKVDRDQVFSYGFGLCMALGTDSASGVVPLRPVSIACRYNLLGQKRFDEADPVTFDDVKAFPSWVDERIRAVEATGGELEPTVGKVCDWCGFKPECPEFAKVGGQLAKAEGRALPERIETREECEKAGAFVKLAEEYLRELKTLCRAYMAEHKLDALPIPGTGWELREVPAKEWEGVAGEVIGEMVRVGIPKAVILERLGVRKSQVEAVVKAATPLRSDKKKGIEVSSEEIAENRIRRHEWTERILDLGTWKHRKPTFGVYSSKDD